jgi:tetratricopeptide (TPR) repeat protein
MLIRYITVGIFLTATAIPPMSKAETYSSSFYGCKCKQPQWAGNGKFATPCWNNANWSLYPGILAGGIDKQACRAVGNYYWQGNPPKKVRKKELDYSMKHIIRGDPAVDSTISRPSPRQEQLLPAESLISKAGELYSQSNYEQAIVFYDKALALEPNSYAALLSRSMAKFEISDFEGTIIDASRAILLDSNLPLAYYFRGRALSESARAAQSIADLSEALRLNPANLAGGRYPKNSDVYNARAISYWDLRDYGNAMSDFQKAIDLDPTDPNTFGNLGRFLIDFGKTAKGCQYLVRSAEMGDTYSAQLLENKYSGCR